MDKQLKVIYAVTIFLSLFLICSRSGACDFRWSDQSYTMHVDASVLHAVGSAYIANSIEDYGLKWWQADLITFGLGTLYEVKDGVVPYEKYEWAGGEGFSKQDLLCDLGGIVTNRLFQVLIKKVKK